MKKISILKPISNDSVEQIRSFSQTRIEKKRKLEFWTGFCSQTFAAGNKRRGKSTEINIFRFISLKFSLKFFLCRHRRHLRWRKKKKTLPCTNYFCVRFGREIGNAEIWHATIGRQKTFPLSIDSGLNCEILIKTIANDSNFVLEQWTQWDEVVVEKENKTEWNEHETISTEARNWFGWKLFRIMSEWSVNTAYYFVHMRRFRGNSDDERERERRRDTQIHILLLRPGT